MFVQGSVSVDLQAFEFVRFYSFGFEQGGQASLHVALENPLPPITPPGWDSTTYIWAMICSTDETQELVVAQDSYHLCRGGYNISNICAAAVQLGGPNQSLTWDATLVVTDGDNSYDFT